MRVVAGEFKGRRLYAPRGGRARPTADKVREALFSILGDISGARVLDLFAGSGALGIEALSRGAREATFVDSAPAAVAAIRRNLEGLEAEARVVRREALAFLGGSPGEGYDLVMIDPPYDSALRLAEPLSERLPPLLNHGARIVTESDKRAPLALDLPLRLERDYGDTHLAIYSHA